MPDVLIRDLDESTLSRLKERAANSGRSLQSEVHQILKQAAEQMSREEFIELTDNLRNQLGHRRFSDSTQDVAEDRQR